MSLFDTPIAHLIGLGAYDADVGGHQQSATTFSFFTRGGHFGNREASVCILDHFSLPMLRNAGIFE